LNAFTLDYCDSKIKIFYSYLQHHATCRAMRPYCSNFKILLNCSYITLTCSIYCVTFLVLSNWFGQWCQIWGISMPFWVFLLKIWGSLGFNCVAVI